MAEMPVEQKMLGCQIDTLRALVEHDLKSLSVELFVILGEQVHDELRQWSNQLITLRGYPGVLSVAPWRVTPSAWHPRTVETIKANTALHAVAILFHDVYRELFPDRPAIMRATDDETEQLRLISQYVSQNHIDFPKRLAWLQAILDIGVMRELLCMADEELEILACMSADEIPDEPAKRSKPLRFSTWHELFVNASYSENTSERSFRTWLKPQIGKTAFRDTQNGPISFDLAFLKSYGVIVPE